MIRTTSLLSRALCSRWRIDAMGLSWFRFENHAVNVAPRISITQSDLLVVTSVRGPGQGEQVLSTALQYLDGSCTGSNRAENSDSYEGKQSKLANYARQRRPLNVSESHSISSL